MATRPGSVSHGTLLAEDLIPRFIAVLPDAGPRADYEKAWRSSRTLPEGDQRAESMEYLVADLIEALDAQAPDGHYFGLLVGNGSDFGFWPVEEEEE